MEKINIKESIEYILDVYRENLNNPDDPELEKCTDCEESYQLYNCVRCVRCGDLTASEDCEGCFEGDQLKKCYGVGDSRQCYKCKYSEDLVRCSFCYECENLRDCVGCSQLYDAQYYINNVSFTKIEYDKIMKALRKHEIAWRDIPHIRAKNDYSLEEEETGLESENDTPGILLYDAEEEEDYCEEETTRDNIDPERDMYYALYGEDGILVRCY